jgi:hypothetical protein
MYFNATPDLHSQLVDAASARGVTPNALASAILRIVLKDSMIDAVLDSNSIRETTRKMTPLKDRRAHILSAIDQSPERRIYAGGLHGYTQQWTMALKSLVADGTLIVRKERPQSMAHVAGPSRKFYYRASATNGHQP